MKQLSSFMVLNLDGGDRVSFTYDVIDEKGTPTSTNNKAHFYVVDEEIKNHINAIRDHIRENRLAGE